MRKLEYSVRGLCWLAWMLIYVGLAAWVGEGLWNENGTRLLAVFLGVVWSLFGLIIIEACEVPQGIVKALLEDD